VLPLMAMASTTLLMAFAPPTMFQFVPSQRARLFAPLTPLAFVKEPPA
jgi:hypothetical protein